ncbi:MerR family transcriptional regulator [Streptomyces sp. NPDC091292]|uniref:MerR family transcriptional regulator n=1 Tax=Streptomyces sp. NPDC091292 TaxID=3365991 RepID=UPI00380D9308
MLGIGDFSARTRLSPKALRLYDRLGLLTPAHVDASSGYRYYRDDQVERARTVALLRRIDMPLARIAEVVEAAERDGEAAARSVAAYWAEVEERIAGQRTLADHLRGRLSGRSSEGYEAFGVDLVDVPERWVLSQSRYTLADGLPEWIGGSLGRLERAAAECGGATGAPFVVYHAEVTEESDGPVESCVPVGDPGAARAWVDGQGRAAWETGLRLEPAGRLAYTRITKAHVAYPQIVSAFEAVEEWVARQGLRVVGPCREVYFADWDAAGPGDEVCDIAFPVADGG